MCELLVFFVEEVAHVCVGVGDRTGKHMGTNMYKYTQISFLIGLNKDCKLAIWPGRKFLN